MTFDTIFVLVGIPLFAHSGLAFFQSFLKGPSQYDDLHDFEISGLPTSVKIQELFKIKLSSGRFCCKDLIAAVLIWSRRLRMIGFLPLMLYVTFIFLLLVKGSFTEDFNVEFLSNILLGVAFLLQVLYILFKLRSNIPQLLMHLPKYEKASFLLILFDVVPLWKR